jgi:hypothetical protein
MYKEVLFLALRGVVLAECSTLLVSEELLNADEILLMR